VESVLVPWSQAEAVFTTETASCSFPQYVSTCPEIREASIESTKLIDEFGIEIGMREDLFQAARAIATESLSGEFKRFHERLLREFKHNGLFLESPEQKALLKEKRQKLADLCTEFSRNMNEDATELLFTRAELDGATEDFLTSLQTCKETGKLRVSMKYPDLFGVLRNVRSERVRELMDTTNGRKCEKNRALLAEAVQLRHECAALLGYAEHASFRLENKMAKEPGKVIAFLRDLQHKLLPFAQKELAKLSALKASESSKKGNKERVRHSLILFS
jgi:Zn-dependent oligopeptidase